MYYVITTKSDCSMSIGVVLLCCCLREQILSKKKFKQNSSSAWNNDWLRNKPHFETVFSHLFCIYTYSLSLSLFSSSLLNNKWNRRRRETPPPSYYHHWSTPKTASHLLERRDEWTLFQPGNNRSRIYYSTQIESCEFLKFSQHQNWGKSNTKRNPLILFV